MSRKGNKGLYFILIILTALVGFWIYNNKINLGNKEENNNTEVKEQGDIKKTDKEYALADNEIREGEVVEIKYPSFGNSKVDLEIKKKIDLRVKDFKESLIAADGQTLEVSYEVNYYSSDIIGIKYNYLYSGGVRPITEVECFTYDLSKSSQIFLSDIFKADSEYLNKLSGLAYDYLIRSSDKDSVKAGTAANNENFSNFILYGDRIVFYYSPCEVDACSSGPKQVPILLSDLSTFLNDNFSAIPKTDQSGLILNDLKEGDLIKTPLIVTGTVNGNNWSGFEGTVGKAEIFDDENNIIASSTMQATSDWLTEIVSFKTTLEFKVPETEKGFVVFYNENPSGLEENNRQQIIRIRFK